MSDRIQIKASDSASATADLILFKSKGEFTPRPFQSKEFEGEMGSSLLFHAPERREIYIGLGEVEKITANVFRQAAGHAIRKAMDCGSEEMIIDVSAFEDRAAVIAEGLVVGVYEFDEFITGKGAAKSVKVTLVGPKKSLKAIRNGISRGSALGHAINYTRHLGNLPGNRITPEGLASEAKILAEEKGLKCRIWSPPELEKEGFGGLLAVGKGSINEPRLIRLDYSAPSKNSPTLVVVGKAITFDSGGLCIKAGDQMEEMKFDKMGGCAVLGILQAAAELQVECNIIGLLSSAENMTGPAAYRPGDIIKTYDGQTVEVANTDAEGRIVLADALGYAREKIKPDLMVDLATLTGACVVALGEERAGLFCDDPKLSLLFQEAGEQTGERIWPLPFGEEFDKQIESKVADVRNLGKTRWGGASTAASFLARWTKGVPHAHLDIAGPAMSQITKSWRSLGATGFGVGLIISFAESWSRITRK